LLSLNSKIWNALLDHIKEHFQIDVEDFSGQLFLKNSNLKGIIAHDTTDTVVRFSEAEKLASSWEKALFIATTGYGHSLHDDELYQKIAAFLVEA
jgi:predicted alpha/beta hydrolase family esterase